MAKILITDDSMFMRVSIKNMLAPLGYTLYEAGNGKEMLDMYEQVMPDLVTLDITMPEMTGIEGLKILKQRHPDAKVIMCSAMGQQAMVIEAVKAGAANFLVKPFEKEKVLSTIDKVLNS